MFSNDRLHLNYLPILSTCSDPACLPLILLARWYFYSLTARFQFLALQLQNGDCMKMYHSYSYLALALVLSQLASSWAPTAPAHKRDSGQHEAKDKSGAVASESSVCSQIGIDLVKDGGNAADAVCLK